MGGVCRLARAIVPLDVLRLVILANRLFLYPEYLRQLPKRLLKETMINALKSTEDQRICDKFSSDYRLLLKTRLMWRHF